MGLIVKRGRFGCQVELRLDFPCCIGMTKARRGLASIGRKLRKPRSSRGEHSLLEDSVRNVWSCEQV
jgi:hypothetical protein